MKAVLFHEFGEIDQLQLVELPKPTLGEAEVLVQVKAAGVNPVDWKILQGRLKERVPHQFPVIPGWEMAGVVVECGHGARRFQPGDEVFSYCRRPVVQFGSYTEFMTLPESYVTHKPNNLSFTEAASVPLAALTAYQSIFSAANLQADETLLVLGASGAGARVARRPFGQPRIWATRSFANQLPVPARTAPNTKVSAGQCAPARQSPMTRPDTAQDMATTSTAAPWRAISSPAAMLVAAARPMGWRACPFRLNSTRRPPRPR